MNYLWNGSLTIALAFVLGSTAIGRADCTCGTCTPAGTGPCFAAERIGPCDNGCVPGPCDNSETPGACDSSGCDTGCDSSYIYRSACSSLESTSDGYLWTYGRGRCAKTFRFDGWVESGIMGNSHGVTSYGGHEGNGPMHVFGNQRTDYALQQIYLLGEKEIDTSNGFDWGFRTDFIYGVDGPGTQSYGDRSFDYDWATNDDGYGLSCYQLMGAVGYKNLTVRGGKFMTPIGWEGVASKDNFFYSHSYCYWLEPSTHVGAFAEYTINDKLMLMGGWTAGHENGFANKFGDSAYLAGFTYALTPKSNFFYYVTQGDTNNGDYNRNEQVFDFTLGDVDKSKYFIQSFVYEWKPTDRFTYVMQYNLRNDAMHFNDGTPCERSSAYGINNHFLYQLTDKVGVGMRAEWLRDNGGYITDTPANYFELTYGVNWNPNRHWSVRPEIRFDWADSGKPFADSTKSSQMTGGVGLLYIF